MAAEGTPYQEGYKYGLKVARGEAQPAAGQGLSEHKGYNDWWSGYRVAMNSEAVRLRRPQPPTEVKP